MSCVIPVPGNGAAIMLDSDSILDLNGFAVLCNNTEREGIVLQGRNVKIRNGMIIGCRNGIVVTGMEHKLKRLFAINNGRDGIIIEESDGNRIKDVHANFNTRTGINIVKSNGNHVSYSLAANNGRQGIKIDGRTDINVNAATNNSVYGSAAYFNCRDGIEIDKGDDNAVIDSLAVSNGNKSACDVFGGSFLPQFYAGFDVTTGSNGNILKNNKASGNQGCNIEPGEAACVPRERNFWDENADENGCFSSNSWENNRFDGETVAPECSPGP